jgi:hypothetical protein
MLSLPRHPARPYPRRVFRHRLRPAALPHSPKTGRRGAAYRVELWRTAFYGALFALLSIMNQPRATDTPGRQLEVLRAPMAAVTAGVASCAVLRALANEFEQQFEPVRPRNDAKAART